MGLDKKALWTISYGMYVITSACDNCKMNGQIANTVIQVASDPVKIATVINKQNLTSDYIKRSGYFAVSVLESSTPMEFIGLFGFKSGRDINKLSLCNFIPGQHCPLVVDNTLSIMEASVTEELDVGSHTIFVGEVIDAKVLKQGEPLTYSTYHANKGKAPKTAPTYQAPEKENKETKHMEVLMKKYVCGVCGYVYDPAKGDPDNGVPAGTPFEKLPDSWVCPVCGAAKSEFSPE